MTAAKIMDIISRLPGFDGQTADAVSAYTQVKMEDAHKLLKIQKSECPDIWIRLPRQKWPKSWSSIEDPIVPLEKNLYGHPLAGLLWERQYEKKTYCNIAGRKSKLEISLCTSWLFLSVNVEDKWLDRKILIGCGKYSMKKPTWENQHLSWMMYTWTALNDNAK